MKSFIFTVILLICILKTGNAQHVSKAFSDSIHFANVQKSLILQDTITYVLKPVFQMNKFTSDTVDPVRLQVHISNFSETNNKKETMTMFKDSPENMFREPQDKER